MKINFERIAEVFSDVEFFMVCVFPEDRPVIDKNLPGALHAWADENCWIVTSRHEATGLTLDHEVDGTRIVFRGYEGEHCVHSYSPPEARAPLSSPASLRNGVFSYLRYDPERLEATIRTDGFGFSPLFMRQMGSSWLFASHPALLHLAGDEPDMEAWASLMQTGHVLDDHSFYKDIQRFPAGNQMTLTREGRHLESWFDFRTLPPGEKTIDDQAFVDVEKAYDNAMQRCIALGDTYTLPLSSGFDSRRFFATLVNRGLPFKAVTCQTFHRKNGRYYDIDAFFAPGIAAKFGVECEVISASPADKMDEDAQRRQALIGTETLMHAWAVPMMKWLSRQPPSIVFDGLAGDTFGNSGYEIDGLHGSPEGDVELILNEVARPLFFANLSQKFPSIEQYRHAYRGYLNRFAPNLNQAEFAFLQARTRRSISPWITMMHPPGHVIVFPYCDMEFALTTLEYQPQEKYKWFFQKECLKRFYPDYFHFPGSRNLPADHPPLSEHESHARDAAEEKNTYGSWSIKFKSMKYLSWKNKFLLLTSSVLPVVKKRRNWLFSPLLSLVKTQADAKPFIEKGFSSKGK